MSFSTLFKLVEMGAILVWILFVFEFCCLFGMLSSFWKVLFVKLEPQTLLQMDQNKILLTVKTVHILWSIYTDYKKELDIFSHSPLFTKWYVCFGFFQHLWSLHYGISDKTEWKSEDQTKGLFPDPDLEIQTILRGWASKY